MSMRLGCRVKVGPMSMVVDVTARVLVLRVAVVDREGLTLVQHGRQANEKPRQLRKITSKCLGGDRRASRTNPRKIPTSA